MRRSYLKRGLEERRRIADTVLRRQRSATLNAKRKQRLTELEVEAGNEHIAPLIFSDEELQSAVRGAIHSIQSSYGNDNHLQNLRYLRTLLTDSEDPPFTLLSQLDATSILLTELTIEQNSKEALQETLWTIAVLADGDLSSAQLLISEATSILPFLSGDHGYDLAECASWIFHSVSCALTSEGQLGNLDIATPLANLFFLCHQAQDKNENDILHTGLTAAWALCSLVAHSIESRKQLLVIPQFASKLSSLLILKHVKILTEAAWLVTYLTAADDDHLEALVNANVVSHLLSVFQISVQEAKADFSEAQELLTPVLRALGNISCGVSLMQIKELVSFENGLMMKCLYQCLQCPHRGLKKESCICLAKIASVCDTTLIDILIQFQILDSIVYFISQAHFDIRNKAALVLANLCFQNNKEPNVEFLTHLITQEKGLVSGIVSLLKDVDLDAVALGLDFTEMILKYIKNGAQLVEEADGIDALDNLHFGNVPSDIQDFACTLVDTYYGEDYGLD